jgi:choline dehydrogenase-like flavoprotein
VSLPTSLIIGSGPAAVGAALALTQHSEQQVTVIDIGTELEANQRRVVDAMTALHRTHWSNSEVAAISQQPVGTSRESLPEKRTYGSDFPFRNVGQLDGIEVVGRANRLVVSSAYGGFSNVWGAQTMPWSASTFDRWPIKWSEMEPHYRSVLQEVPFTGVDDDLSELFPLLVDAQEPPKLAARSRMVLDRYSTRRAAVRAQGITVGVARLALDARSCVRCGLCMTGCPYSLIYSASHSFDRLRAAGRISYVAGVLAYRIGEQTGRPFVEFRELATGGIQRLEADRIFVACGAMGTTRLVLGSLGHFGRDVSLAESVQFVLPTFSSRAAIDPREENDFTLNQFNVVVDTDGGGFNLAQVHFYPYNPVFLAALPSFLRARFARTVTTSVLRRLSVGLGYLPSWESPRVHVVAQPSGDSMLPTLTISGDDGPRIPPMLRAVMRRLLRAAPSLDLWPVLPNLTVSSTAKSYHYGGSFPHADGKQRAVLETDRMGRLSAWENVHLVDASVFPTVAATTFTLTIMANAHRIATEVLGGHNE